MSEPRCVLLSDIHYNLQNLPLADAALRQAVEVANSLQVPLIIAGDVHDTKANVRGECIKAMRDTLSQYYVPRQLGDLLPIVLVGNHDMINSNGKEHALHFLEGVADIVSKPTFTNEVSINGNSLYLIPYYSDVEALKAHLSTLDKNSAIIMHQGIKGSLPGAYESFDKSAISPAALADFRVISGHYHARQDIKCGRLRKGMVGTASYLGSPYTQSFGEANDPEKGFSILMSDGSLKLVPTNLRKHIVYETNADKMLDTSEIPPIAKDGDLIWVKVKGTKEQLSRLSKWEVAEILGYDSFDIRLDLIPTDRAEMSQIQKAVSDKASTVALDDLIDSYPDMTTEQKDRLKLFWKELQ